MKLMLGGIVSASPIGNFLNHTNNTGQIERSKNISETSLRNNKHIPRGLVAVTNTSNWVVQEGKRINLFALDYVDCVSNYETWRNIEPATGKYNWRGFDRMMEEATKSNKKIAYHILAGNHAPDWTYEFANVLPYNPNGLRKNLKTYLPWIEKNGLRELNNNMLSVWKKTITAFSAHIHQHPQKDRIAYVAITGGPMSNGLEIMWGQNYEEFSALRWDENAENLLIEYWKSLVDIFVEAFPDIPLGLAFTDYFGVNAIGMHRRSYRESQMVVEYALKIAESKGQTIMPMGLWFGLISPGRLNHPLIKMLRSFHVPFGLQGEMGTPTAKDLDKMLAFAIDVGTSWFELWHHDIIRREYVPVMSTFCKHLKA